MFIIGANAGGYGVDRCLGPAPNAARPPPTPIAAASSTRPPPPTTRVDRDDITGAIPSDGSGGCHGGRCDNLVAIVCTR